MADWIWMCLMLRGDAAFCQLVPEALPPKKQAIFPSLHIHYTNVYQSAASVEQVQTPMPSPSEKTMTELQALWEMPYQSEALGQVSLISVSAISKAESPDTLTLKRPRCVRTDGKRMTGAEHGTAVHAFFQYCRFSYAQQDALAEVRNLHRMGYLTEEQMKTIQGTEIIPFFSHALYHRICQAEQVLRERKFLVRLGDLPFSESSPLAAYRHSESMLKGILDLAFLEDDCYVLVDYKTDAVSDGQILKDRYTMQLYIYRLALEQMTGKQVKECWIYSTHLQEAIAVDCKDG
jgi:ATP-dependent helicase/nuclease subunit A